MSATDSFDLMHSNSANYGLLNRTIFSIVTTTTNATSTSGYTNCSRFTDPLIIPSVAAPVTGFTFTLCDMIGTVQSANYLAALEYVLGTLTISGNVFASGVTMPTKTIKGTSLQTASYEPLLWVNTALTATTPVITITYTNQDGVGSRTATLTLPTSSALNTCFRIMPHLQAGDTGIQSVQNISTNTGSGGVLKVLGVLPVGFATTMNTASEVVYPPLRMPFPMFKAEAGETLSFYKYASTGGQIVAVLAGVPETT